MADRFTKKRMLKRKKRNKKIKIFMIASIIILLGAFVVLVIGQVSTLQKETNKIRNMAITEETLDTRIYTTGSFMAVEKTIKDYTNEYVTKLKEVTGILNDEDFSDMLSEENIENDGPYFYNSKSCLHQKRELCETDFTKLKELVSSDCIYQAIKEAGLSGINAKLCEYYLNSLQMEFMHTHEEFEEAYQQIIEKLEQKDQVLDYLIENKDFWKCTEGKLTFESPLLREEFNSLAAVNTSNS